MAKRLDDNGLLYFWQQLKSKLADKVDKETGKGLSTNDYTTAEKTKLAGVAEGATANVGTITGVTMNGASKGTSGVVDLGTVVTDVSGKENTSNKVVSWSATTTDAHYPSEKLVKASLDGKANSSHTHTKSQITDFPTLATVATSGNYNDLSNKPTIPTVPAISTNIETDASSDSKTASPKAVKTYVDAKVGSTYKAGGSKAFASLPTPSASVEGYVYNVTDAFTTDARFVEGSGKDYPAGTNVAVINTGSSVYKFDVMSGFVDMTAYWSKAELVAITNAEIDTILAQ